MFMFMSEAYQIYNKESSGFGQEILGQWSTSPNEELACHHWASGVLAGWNASEDENWGSEETDDKWPLHLFEPL